MENRKFENRELAAAYAKFRPLPPQEIIDRILKYLEGKIQSPYGHVLDVGCGNGQSSVIWKPYFQNITGCDISPAQIEEAKKNYQVEGVNFILCPAEKIPLPDNSVQMVSVCTALHWFNIEEFLKEAKRLLVKNGVLAVYSYHSVMKLIFHTEEKTHMGNILLKKLFYNKVEEFMSPTFKILDDNYSTVYFPFDDVVRCSGIRSRIEVNVDELIGYIHSHSSYQGYYEKSPQDAEFMIKQLKESLIDVAGGETEKFIIEKEHCLILCS